MQSSQPENPAHISLRICAAAERFFVRINADTPSLAQVILSFFRIGLPAGLLAGLTAAMAALCLNGTIINTANAAASSPPALSAASTADDPRNNQPGLSQRTRLRFLTTTDFPPFNTISSEGKLSGYHIDLVRAICQELALTAICQIEARPWAELIENLKNGNADAIIAGINISTTTRANLSFSRPYLSLPARFVALKSKAEKQQDFTTEGQVIGVIADTSHEIMLRNYYPQAAVRPYKTSGALYQALIQGKTSVIFGDALTLSLWLSDKNNDGANISGNCCQFASDSYPAPQILGQGMSIALGKNDEPLRKALNNALQALERKGVLEELYLRYFPIGFY